MNRLTSKTFPNGITTNYTYDSASQLLSIQNVIASPEGVAISKPSDFHYNYDNLYRRTAMQDKDGVHNYNYDVLSRLLQATHPSIQSPTNPDEQFTYDANGNRLSKQYAVGSEQSTNNELRTTNYEYDIANRLTEDSNFTYEYDANGNLISQTSKKDLSRKTFIYNDEDQLIELKRFRAQNTEHRTQIQDSQPQPEPYLIARYYYDALGRRIGKEVNNALTYYIYDGDDIIAEYTAFKSQIPSTKSQINSNEQNPNDQNTSGAILQAEGDTSSETILRLSTLYIHGTGIDSPLAKIQGRCFKL